jgi:twitching motility protein PilT
MQSLDDAILDALQSRKISEVDAYDKALVKDRFIQFLKTPPEFI